MLFPQVSVASIKFSREIYEEIGGIALRKEIEREKVVAYCRVFDCMMSKLQFFSQCGKFLPHLLQLLKYR